jgi:hypothetical protein
MPPKTWRSKTGSRTRARETRPSHPNRSALSARRCYGSRCDWPTSRPELNEKIADVPTLIVVFAVASRQLDSIRAAPGRANSASQRPPTVQLVAAASAATGPPNAVTGSTRIEALRGQDNRSPAAVSLATFLAKDRRDVVGFLVAQGCKLYAWCASTRFGLRPKVHRRALTSGSAAGEGSAVKARGCAMHRGLPSPALGCRRCATPNRCQCDVTKM